MQMQIMSHIKKKEEVASMKQLELELQWLSEEWIPKEVSIHKSNVCKIGMSPEEFDEYQSMQYGYKSYSDMITHNNKIHQEKKLSLGDKYIAGWME